MKTKKHDTQWMVSVALMAAIVILLANTPLGMIQLPIIKATTVHIPVIIGAILLTVSRGNSWICVWCMFTGEQHNGTNPFVFCIFSVHEHYWNSGSNQGNLDFCRMPYVDWNRSRMVMDSL